MRDWVMEIGYAFRTLAKTPVTVGVTLLSLGLAIGAVTGVFSFASAFFLRGDPEIADPDRLAVVWVSDGPGSAHSFGSFLDFESIQRSVPGFSQTAAVGVDVRRLGDSGEGAPVTLEVVSGGFFDVAGIGMRAGRSFQPDETVPGQAEPVVIIGEAFWDSHFDGSSSALGSSLQLNGLSYTIIGVAPRKLRGRLANLQIAAWVPMGVPGSGGRRTVEGLAIRSDRDYMIFGRMAEGATVAGVEAQLANLSEELLVTYPSDWTDDAGESRFFTVTTGKDAQMPPEAKLALLGAAGFLFAATALVLAIACANVAGLFLARARRRRREMAIRAALGAGRARLARLLLAESLVLGLAAGMIGVFLAQKAVMALNTIDLPLDIPLSFDFGVDYRVLAFAVLLSAAAAALFGLAPALEGSKPNVVSSLKGENGERVRKGWFRVREFLVVTQVAVSMVLLVGASLLLRGLSIAGDTDLGLDPDGIAVVASQLDTQDRVPANYQARIEELDAALRGRAGVAGVEFSRGLEAGFTADAHRAELEIPGYEPAPGEGMTVKYNSVTPGYLELLGVEVIQGRGFAVTDGPTALPVAVVSQAFAARFWPDGSALGRTIQVRGRRIFGDRAGGEDGDFQVRTQRPGSPS